MTHLKRLCGHKSQEKTFTHLDMSQCESQAQIRAVVGLLAGVQNGTLRVDPDHFSWEALRLRAIVVWPAGNGLCVNFSYVCPEPVLVKWSFLV